MTDDYALAPGSRFLVSTAEDDDTIGHFRGYTMIGSESAIVIEMDGGRIRFIPVSQISHLDLLEPAGGKPPARDRPEHLYG